MKAKQNDATILGIWPDIEVDLKRFLSDTDQWIIENLEAAHGAGDWKQVGKIIGVMKTVHAINHAH